MAAARADRRRKYESWIVRQFVPAFLVLLGLSLVASPAQSDPPADLYAPGRALIADIDRIVTPNSIQETFEATLGGARQVVNVRGADRNNPVILFIHGGPGAVEIPIAWSFQRPWEAISPSFNMISGAQANPIGSTMRKSWRRRSRSIDTATMPLS